MSSVYTPKGPLPHITRWSMMPSHGFLSIPTSDSALNGWGDPTETAEGNPINPPLGTVNGPNSVAFLGERRSQTADQWTVFRHLEDRWDAILKRGYYGNIDWVGPNGEVLSWDGVPSRYFDQLTDYSYWESILEKQWLLGSAFKNPLAKIVAHNLQSVDSPIGTNLFTGRLYRQGRFFFGVGASRVAGAAITTDAQGVQWLLAVRSITGDRISSEELVRWPLAALENNPPAEVLATLTYTLAASGPPVNISPWFFNRSGTEAVALRQTETAPASGEYRYRVYRLTSDGTLIDDGYASTVSYTDDFDRTNAANASGGCTGAQDRIITQTGDLIIAADYVGDTLVLAKIAVNNSDTKHIDGESTNEGGDPQTYTATSNQTILESEILSFSAVWTQTVALTSRNDTIDNTSTQTTTFSGTTWDITTTYNAAIQTRSIILWMDLRFGAVVTGRVTADAYQDVIATYEQDATVERTRSAFDDIRLSGEIVESLTTIQETNNVTFSHGIDTNESPWSCALVPQSSVDTITNYETTVVVREGREPVGAAAVYRDGSALMTSLQKTPHYGILELWALPAWTSILAYHNAVYSAASVLLDNSGMATKYATQGANERFTPIGVA